jgi:hypothetical protein
MPLSTKLMSSTICSSVWSCSHLSSFFHSFWIFQLIRIICQCQIKESRNCARSTDNNVQTFFLLGFKSLQSQ